MIINRISIGFSEKDIPQVNIYSINYKWDSNTLRDF
jgi:hypothetical protein